MLRQDESYSKYWQVSSGILSLIERLCNCDVFFRQQNSPVLENLRANHPVSNSVQRVSNSHFSQPAMGPNRV